MTTLNATVTAAYAFTEDADGKVWLTKDRLNLLGTPTVTVDLALQIATADLIDGSVTTAKIADANVTTAKIKDDAVTTAKILDDNVTTAKILDDNITTAKILDDNITTAKILDENVTADKLEDAVADKVTGTHTITEGAEGVATLQVVDVQGNNLAAKTHFTWWVSDAAAGAPSAAAPDSGTALTTGIALGVHTADVWGEGVTDASGVCTITLTESGAKTYYLNVAIQGKIVSEQLDFA